MKSKFIAPFLFCTQLLSAQVFTEVVPDSPLFEELHSGSVTFADVNSDGHPDVLLTGEKSDIQITKLYLNDGLGNFSEITNTPFDGVVNGSAAFSDINGDGYPDVLIIGERSDIQIAKLYLNDGVGNFTEMMDTPFEGVSNGSIAFSDVNGDGSPDILITGRKYSWMEMTKLYLNDGMGNFSEMMDTPFEDVADSSIAFSDVNGDGYPDVLITGAESSSLSHAKLYLNDGLGNFSEMMNTPLEGVRFSSVAFSDINGDAHIDVLITGLNDLWLPTTKLYLNNGIGNFSEMTNTPFEQVASGSAAFSDINGDGYTDVLLTGINDLWFPVTKLYLNDGLGNFTEMIDTPFEGVSDSSVAFSDINGDGDTDLFIMGRNRSYFSVTELYTNDGLGNFSRTRDPYFEQTAYGSIGFSDINGDGFPDVLSGGFRASLYTNNGTGTFFKRMETGFEEMQGQSLAFSDVNGDGYTDVLMTKAEPVQQECHYFCYDLITKLFTNDGSGNFTRVMSFPVMHWDLDHSRDAYATSMAFSDVNADGHVDVVITGLNRWYGVTTLLLNDGMGNFSPSGHPFDGVYNGSVTFSDVNGDSYPDVLITGKKFDEIEVVKIAKLYLNDGIGHFTEIINVPFEGVSEGSAAFSDVNGDNHPDVLITGRNSDGLGVTKLYTNDGLGNFLEMTDTPFEGVADGSVAFSNVNSDNHPDVLITGKNNDGLRIAKLYSNDGLGNFHEIMKLPFEGVSSGSVAFSDVNGDGHPDVLISGINNSEKGMTKLYLNDGIDLPIPEPDPGTDTEPVVHSEFLIYPNPARTGWIKINLPYEINHSISISILDFNGRLVSQWQQSLDKKTASFSLDISSLHKGAYILQLDSEVKKEVHKLFIQ